MPTNRIEIEWEPSKGIEAKLWDQEGKQHDITDVMQMLTGATGVGKVYTKLALGNGIVATDLGFQPMSEELTIDVPDSVTRQILGLLQK